MANCLRCWPFTQRVSVQYFFPLSPLLVTGSVRKDIWPALL